MSSIRVTKTRMPSCLNIIAINDKYKLQCITNPNGALRYDIVCHRIGTTNTLRLVAGRFKYSKTMECFHSLSSYIVGTYIEGTNTVKSFEEIKGSFLNPEAMELLVEQAIRL